MKKFVCTVCGYIHEGDAAPEQCPICKAPAAKFNELKEDAGYATMHILGEAQGVDEEIIKDLRDNFNGECSEVGMYLAMARVADREGYPEVAAAFEKYAFEEAVHAAKFAELRQALALVSLTLQREQRLRTSTLSTTQFTKWQRTKQDMAQALRDF